MKTPFFRFVLCLMMSCLSYITSNQTVAAPLPSAEGFCGVIDYKHDNRNYARTFAQNLNVGEPRTVRMLYFLPNDRPYREDVVQRMKDEILNIQAFYAEAMQAHGYQDMTFKIETDAQGEPMVHRVDGQHPLSYYAGLRSDRIFKEMRQTFDFYTNIYFVILEDTPDRETIITIILGGPTGLGASWSKSSGYVLASSSFRWEVAAHELGHAFGLQHDFRNDAYIMSYGPIWNGLSACSADFLSIHPWFNTSTPIEKEGTAPIIELISQRTYLTGATSVPVQLKISDPEGIHQVIMHVPTQRPHSAYELLEVKSHRKLVGETEAVIQFEYDGVIPSDGFTNLHNPVVHPFSITVIDMNGNRDQASFNLAQISPYYINTIDENIGGIISAALSPNGTILATGTTEGRLKLWDIVTQANITTIDAHTASVDSIAFSPDGTILASGLREGIITLWDTTTWSSIDTLSGHTRSVTALSFSSDGNTLASGSFDTTIRLWDMARRQSNAILQNHERTVRSVIFSPDGNTLASKSDDNIIILWDVKSKINVVIIQDFKGWGSMSFSPDGNTLAIGRYRSPSRFFRKDGSSITLWDIATQQSTNELFGHTDGVYSISFSPNGSILASGSGDNMINLWDAVTGELIMSLGNLSTVLSVLFSPDGMTLIARLSDGTINFWDISGELMPYSPADIVLNIPDPNLRNAIANQLGKAKGEPITQGDMAVLTKLNLDQNISNLTGLEFASRVESLTINGSLITDLSPVLHLTQLKSLHLNNIKTDISPIAKLTGITRLNINKSSLNISPLASLTRLTHLRITNSSITGISSLSLEELTSLSITNSSISDISTFGAILETELCNR